MGRFSVKQPGSIWAVFELRSSSLLSPALPFLVTCAAAKHLRGHEKALVHEDREKAEANAAPRPRRRLGPRSLPLQT